MEVLDLKRQDLLNLVHSTHPPFVGIEMIANDDVGAIRKIPVRLARAAVETMTDKELFEFYNKHKKNK